VIYWYTRWDEPLNDDASSSSGVKYTVDAKKEKESPERNITAADALQGILKSSSVGKISAHSSHELQVLRRSYQFNSRGWQFIQDVIDDQQRKHDEIINEMNSVHDVISKADKDISRAQKEIDDVQQSLMILEKQILDVNKTRPETDEITSDEKKVLNDKEKQLRRTETVA
jgi:chromosome segregation ATPase